MKFIQEANNDSTSTSHEYLLFDLKRDTPDWLRFRTSRDGLTYVYIPRKKYKYSNAVMAEVISYVHFLSSNPVIGGN